MVCSNIACLCPSGGDLVVLSLHQTLASVYAPSLRFRCQYDSWSSYAPQARLSIIDVSSPVPVPDGFQGGEPACFEWEGQKPIFYFDYAPKLSLGVPLTSRFCFGDRGIL